MAQTSQSETPRAVYTSRRNAFAGAAARLASQSSKISVLRLVVALIAVLSLLGAIWDQASLRTVFASMSSLGLVGFVALVVYHRRVIASQTRCAELAAINAQSLARIDRDWGRIPLSVAPPDLATAPAAADLDLFGPRSLFHLIAPGATPQGRRTLAEWLSRPATPRVVTARQQAVTQLSSAIDLRQKCARFGGRISREGGEAEPFLAWAESDGWLKGRRALVWIARLLPVLLVVFAALQLAGVVSISLWLLVATINVAISFIYCRQIHKVFGQISTNVGQIKEYVKLFEAVASCVGDSERLRAIRGTIGHDADSAIVALRRLGRIMDLADLRFSQIHGIIQAITLWDIHVLALAESWKRRSGARAREWFAALGEFEALAALAAVRYDNPDWCFATLVDAGVQPSLVATSLAHPLLPDHVRIANDVTVGPPGTFLLVTGSNMSGKSTLLRSIGVNAVLAQAGSPVCAQSFTLPPVVLGTSIRVQDSLGDGVSLFLAELKRLKQIVDLASEKRSDATPLVLYLLDEILHGTNTAERQIAVRRVMTHLIAQRAIGVISTHDLALADVEPLSSHSKAVHFQESYRETPAGREMTFDYRLRPGIATTTNALALLEMVGLSLDA
jgi:hypothetical protein